jgi:signal transduction histidine kinase
LELHDKYAHLAPVLLGVAHEFRNPLQGIMASVAVIQTRLEDDDSVRPFLEMIQSDTARINDLINDMLELTRPIQADVRPQTITTILEDAVRSVEDERLRRGATITLTAANDLPLIHADGQMLSRAFGALIRNAIQSSEVPADVSIMVENPGELCVQIQDNGDGIESENLSKIFEPFFSTRRKHAGLGLCIADRAVDAHQGRISVESAKGRGSKIIVTLPVHS